MISTKVRAQVEKDGTLKLPKEVWAEIGMEQPREIELFMRLPFVVGKPVTPVKLTDEDRARIKRIGELIEETFKGMDMEYVREGRRDRWS